MPAIASAVMELSETGPVWMREIETGGDNYAWVVSRTELTDQQAWLLYLGKDEPPPEVEPAAMFADVTDEEAFEEQFRAQFAPGRRVRFAHADHGYPADQEMAAGLLILGEVYTLAWSAIGFSSSRLGLAGIESRGMGFNSVLFEPVDDQEAAKAALGTDAQ
jgi:hypothetical protein